jgi:excisionase family DNA binding protein
LNKKLVKIEDLSLYLDTPVATLYTWTHQRKIPHVKMGRCLRFDLAEIDLWVDQRKVARFEARKPALV